MTRLTIISILTFCSLMGIAKNDSLYYNSKSKQTDKILFYDKDCFIWIRTDISYDTALAVTFGQFKTIGDTVYFSYPDTTRQPNKYFCYCPAHKGEGSYLRLYTKNDTYGSIARVYKDMFKTKPPNLTEIHTIIEFKSVRQKGKIKIFDTEYLIESKSP